MIVRFASRADAAALAALALKTFNDAFMPFNREEDMVAYTKDAFTAAQQLREIEDTKIVTLVVCHPEPFGFAQGRLREKPGRATGAQEPADSSPPPAQVPRAACPERSRRARDDGRLIAYAQVRPTPGAPHGEVELARFYVDQAHHGRGIAQALMAAVDAEARRLGARRIWLGVWERNHRAIAFYRKCGFEQCGTHPFLLGTDLQTDWDMVRELADYHVPL